MLKNYLTISLRTLIKQRGYTLINITSLAAGLTCFTMIVLFIQHELSYDHFHENKERIYRVIQDRPSPSGSFYWSVTSPALAHTLKDEFSEVARSTTVGAISDPLLSIEGRYYKEDGILADEHFFEIFTFPLSRGNPKTALANPNHIVLTTSLAQKIFGDQDPIGQTLTFKNADVFEVTGIVADPPETSHISFSYILPVMSDSFYPLGIQRAPWYNNGWYTYVLLNEGATAEQMEAHMKTFIDENLAAWRPEDRMTFLFEPITDIHLSTEPVPDAFRPGGNMAYVYLFLAIGFAILLLACINYMNLALARSMKRAREVGMRKVIGAVRSQLIGQFMGESVLLTVLALIFSIGIIQLLLPFFGYLMERPVTMDFGENPFLIPGLFVLVILVGIIAGSYPALYMSSLQPIHILKGLKGGKRSGIGLQKLLIIGQYAVSIILVAGSFVVFEQLQFIKNRELGYNREHIVTVRASDPTIGEQYDQIREEWLNDARVLAVTYSRFLPINVGSRQRMFDWEGSQGESLSTSTSSVDYDFLDVFDIELIAGRNFSQEFASDENAVLVNEKTVRALGWTNEEALGQQFDFSDSRSGTLRTIVGIVKDFHYNSVHDEIGPLVLTLERNRTGYISARIRPEDLPNTLALFEESVTAHTDFPFEYAFLDDGFDALYKQDRRLGETFRFFTILALLIASLGLFGLAVYTAEERTKEIGVRKVLGASARSIMLMLTTDFAKLVLIAAVIATPIAYFFMQEWLTRFAYRIDVGPKIFIFTIGLTLLISVLSVSSQAIRAALANPVDSLRHD